MEMSEGNERLIATSGTESAPSAVSKYLRIIELRWTKSPFS